MMLRLARSGTLLLEEADEEEGGDLANRYLLLGDDTSPFSNVGISCRKLCTS